MQCAVAEEIKEKQSKERTELLKSSLAKYVFFRLWFFKPLNLHVRYAVSGKEEDWADVLGEQGVVSVKKWVGPLFSILIQLCIFIE